MNPFLRHLRAGELITCISIERSELDDDYIVITFLNADRLSRISRDELSNWRLRLGTLPKMCFDVIMYLAGREFIGSRPGANIKKFA